MSQKTDVYSWRVSPATKSRLQDVARRERRTVAQILDEIVAEHLDIRDGEAAADLVRQRDLQARAARFAGSIAGSDPKRSTRARAIVKARLRAERARAR